MSRTRRSSVSIYDYPEHLNPFNEGSATGQPNRDGKSSKESKHKFWTFGRSRKRGSNSFSIKSTWNGLFGKRKDVPEIREKRSTITTVSSTYKRDSQERPVAQPRISRDQQEFDEALGTLARRRKYTLDSASRCSSSITVNGDPARIYDGSPQDTTTSIMGDLTPKPPARRFGQVSPRPTDKLPPLNFEDREPKENGAVAADAKESTPVPPMRRFGNRSSQRLIVGSPDTDDESRIGDVTLRDENENVPDDYVFKRCSQDVVRQSNLSINSCVSVTSTMSTYGRKKRRAPQPPLPPQPAQRREQSEIVEKAEAEQEAEAPTELELQIVEPIDIARVTENIDQMTRKNQELDNTLSQRPEDKAGKSVAEPISSGEGGSKIIAKEMPQSDEQSAVKIEPESKIVDDDDDVAAASTRGDKESPSEGNNDVAVDVEYRRSSREKLEILKDVDQANSLAELEVTLRRKSSSETLSRSDSFSVKDEIDKIERQIKALESKNGVKESTTSEAEASDRQSVSSINSSSRLSIQANRRHFFQDMVDESSGKNGIKIEIKELPREQKDIRVVRLTDPPLPVVAPREPVKVIELHISEPIRQRPEMVEEVNPIPKPRRHNSFNLNNSESAIASREERKSFDLSDKRGKSF